MQQRERRRTSRDALAFGAFLVTPWQTSLWWKEDDTGREEQALHESREWEKLVQRWHTPEGASTLKSHLKPLPLILVWDSANVVISNRIESPGAPAGVAGKVETSEIRWEIRSTICGVSTLFLFVQLFLRQDLVCSTDWLWTYYVVSNSRPSCLNLLNVRSTGTK